MSVRSLTQVLPGELLINIMQFALTVSTGELDVLGYTKQLQTLAAIDKRFRLALLFCLSRNFAGIPPSQPMFAYQTGPLSSPWLPTPNARQDYSYWSHANGPDWSDRMPMALSQNWLRAIPTPALQRIAIDLRVDTLAYTSRLRWAHLDACQTLRARQAGDWVLSTSILNYMTHKVFPSLASVYIRLSPQQEQIDMVFTLLRDQPHLRHITVEVDSIMDHPPWGRPRLDLSRLSAPSKQYAPLDTLIIRAPGCQLLGWDDPTLLVRLREATEVRLAALSANFRGEAWDGCLSFLRAVSQVEYLEFGIVLELKLSSSPAYPPVTCLEPVVCPRLLNLTVQLPDVDARFLSRLHAPNLTVLRIRCRGDLDGHGRVPTGHFPGLSYFRSACHTFVYDRVKVVGFGDGTLVSPGSGPFQAGDYGDFTIHINPDIDACVASPPNSTHGGVRANHKPEWIEGPRIDWLSAARTSSALLLDAEGLAKRDALIKASRKISRPSPMRAYIDAELADMDRRSRFVQNWLDNESEDDANNETDLGNDSMQLHAGPSRRRAVPTTSPVLRKRARIGTD